MRKKIEAECHACGGTGVYCGIMEPKNIGVICLDCGGTGKYHIVYTPFERKKGKNNISFIQISNSQCIINAGPKGNKIPYKEFKQALTYEDIDRLVKKYNK